MYRIAKGNLLGGAALLILAGAAGVGPSQAAAATNQCNINVGPNTQVTDHSKDPGLYAFETSITVNPRDKQNLVVGILTADPPRSSVAVPKKTSPREDWIKARFYFTSDGGASWLQSQWADSPVADLIREGRATHPMVVFGLNGAAIATADTSSSKLGIDKATFGISDDGGRNWSRTGFAGEDAPGIPAASLPKGWDGMRWGADLTNSPYRGNIYGTTVGKKEASFLIIKPNSKRWIWKSAVTVADIDRELNVPIGTTAVVKPGRSILVSRSGRIVLPVTSWSSGDKESIRGWLIESIDGGATFAPPQPLPAVFGDYMHRGNVDLANSWALDDSDGPFKDRVYRLNSALNERTGKWELLFSYGKSATNWSGLRLLEVLENPNDVIARGSYTKIPQTQPAMAVNKRGIILISWYRFFEAPTDGGVAGHQRFVSASIDGGQTFLSPVQLASVPTTQFVPPDGIKFRTGANGDLGHFMQIATDADGIFHAAWLDGRTGKQELWYASINVACNGTPAKSRRWGQRGTKASLISPSPEASARSVRRRMTAQRSPSTSTSGVSG